MTRSPLFWYAAVTAAVPLANGAPLGEHILTVLAAVAALATAQVVRKRLRCQAP